MTTASVYLLGKDDLLREGIKSLLLKGDFCIAGEYDEVSDMPAAAAPDIVIGIDGEAGDLSEKVCAIKNIYAGSRIVIVSARTEMPVIMPIFSAGVDGYILKDISSDGFLGSLRLVTAGEKVFPTFMLVALSQSQQTTGALVANDMDKGETVRGRQLSRQELRIVHCLANGDPNKIIAHHLEITEATVKVHVKTILRKLGARNRTQAALWAASQGMSEPPRQMMMRG